MAGTSRANHRSPSGSGVQPSTLLRPVKIAESRRSPPAGSAATSRCGAQPASSSKPARAVPSVRNGRIRRCPGPRPFHRHQNPQPRPRHLAGRLDGQIADSASGSGVLGIATGAAPIRAAMSSRIGGLSTPARCTCQVPSMIRMPQPQKTREEAGKIKACHGCPSGGCQNSAPCDCRRPRVRIKGGTLRVPFGCPTPQGAPLLRTLASAPPCATAETPVSTPPDVDRGEEEQPHHVDEVPATRPPPRKPDMVLGGEMPPSSPSAGRRRGRSSR